MNSKVLEYILSKHDSNGTRVTKVEDLERFDVIYYKSKYYFVLDISTSDFSALNDGTGPVVLIYNLSDQLVDWIDIPHFTVDVIRNFKYDLFNITTVFRVEL